MYGNRASRPNNLDRPSEHNIRHLAGVAVNLYVGLTMASFAALALAMVGALIWALAVLAWGAL